jgi:hypothetical protein
MHAVRPRTPPLVRVMVVALLVGGPAWWFALRHDRLANERRLAEVASAIAGRDVRVRCPGVVGRVLSWDTVEGSVRFDAGGRPADEARLRVFACKELDALAEGRREAALACAVRPRPGCGIAAADVALAVDVLAHESWHLAGVVDEAETECRAVRSLPWTAQRLGATAEESRALARVYLATGHPRLPARYRSGRCDQK